MMKTEILKKLRNTNEYISGQTICKELGVSRTAVWKAVNQLKEEGYEFEAVQNKGYKIAKYPDLITKSEIESQIDQAAVIKNVKFFQEVDSTNNEAKRSAENGAADGTLFIAESQTGGRGRRGKNWVSPAGSGIWMSLLLRPQLTPTYAPMLTLIAAVAAAEAIAQVMTDASPDVCTQVKIKWPNDIVVNGRKVCGILTEMSAEMDSIHFVVIGLGINVNTTEFEDSIKDIASSLYAESGQHIKRAEIVLAFEKAFTRYYQYFQDKQDLSKVQDTYNSMLINVGRQVRVTEQNGDFTGIAKGTNEKGELIVQKQDGSEVCIAAGEVSVRGLYGYV
jgi:BirA family biotin operon repressor/biotin-[acetyl-CoA-carboxylase] ligase